MHRNGSLGGPLPAAPTVALDGDTLRIRRTGGSKGRPVRSATIDSK